MKPPTHFHFTAHAKKRAEERGITEDLFKQVVLQHEKKTRQYRGKNGGFVYPFSRKYGEKEFAHCRRGA